MENPEPTRAGDPRPRPGTIGCNLIALVLLLAVVMAFVAAAWINNPEQAPNPASTGVPPTAPAD